MKFVLEINNSEKPEAAYVGWTPVECMLYIENHKWNENPLPITVTVGNTNGKGRLSLYKSNAPDATPVKELKYDFRSTHSPNMTFYIAGKYPYASVAEKDTYIKVEADNGDLGSIEKKVMVRVRKNVEHMEEKEIEKFLAAWVRLNKDAAKGSYKGSYTAPPPTSLLHEIILMHSYDTANEIHDRRSFHPWHRAFALHLERELQNVDPTVTLPYWRFDQPAPTLFAKDFIGKTEYSNEKEPNIHNLIEPKFSLSNPLFTYAKNTLWGPLRRSYNYKKLNPAESKPNDSIRSQSDVINETDTFIGWGWFEERRSHNPAHAAFSGHVVDIGRDPADPLFFLLHSNVDRLWALWQEKHDRYDSTQKATYPFLGKYDGLVGQAWIDENEDKVYLDGNDEPIMFAPDDEDIGNFSKDTLWPWNKFHEASRPSRAWYAPGYAKTDKGSVPQINIPFPTSPTSSYPADNHALTLSSTIDYQNRLKQSSTLGFDYDDVPYFDRDKEEKKEAQHEVPMINRMQFNQDFLNNDLSVNERLEAAKHAIIESEQDVDATVAILLNQQEPEEIRLRALQLVDHTTAKFLEVALEIITSSQALTSLRLEAIHQVLAAKRWNRHFHNIAPQFYAVLRGLIKHDDKRLGLKAISILAAHEDRVVQEFLVEELEKVNNSYLPKEIVISLLRQSNKPQHTQLFRKIFENKNENDTVRVAALEGLSTDTNSKALLKEVVQNANQKATFRTAAALALHHLDSALMNEIAAQHIEKTTSNNFKKNAGGEGFTEDQTHFKALLLNMLLYTADKKHLVKAGLKKGLQQLRNISTDSELKLQSVNKAAGLPKNLTILNKLSSKLLQKIQRDEDDQ